MQRLLIKFIFLILGCFLVFILINKINYSIKANRYASAKFPAFNFICNDELKECIATLSNNIVSTQNYMNLGAQVKQFPPEWTVTLELTGQGGEVSTVLYLYNMIEKSKATVNTHIVGPCYSAHAMIALLGNNIEVDDAAFIMLHRPAYAVQTSLISGENVLPEFVCDFISVDKDRGKDGKEKCLQMVHYQTIAYEKLFDDKIKKFLNKKELERYNQGYDVYISAQELQKRIEIIKHKELN